MEKRKIKTRVFAFASTFIILISLCATVAFAQAPEITTNNNPNLVYYNVLVYDDLGSQGDNVLAYFHVRVSLSTYQLYSIDCVLTEYYYSEYYLYDYVTDLSGSYDISISSKNSGDQGGPGSFYDDEYIVEALNHFNFFYYSGNPNNNLVNSTTISNCVTNSINNQFIYWEEQVSNSYDEGFENGLENGTAFGYEEGYEAGRSYGYTQALTDVEALENAFVTIFNAPFDFLTNLSEVQLFGISIFDIVGVILVLALGYLLLRFIGGAIPL